MATYYAKQNRTFTSKPVGSNVEIDWEHPLAPSNCYLNNGALPPRNIAKKDWPDFAGAFNGMVSTPIGPLGTFGDDTSISTGLTINPPFTIHARFYRQGNAPTTPDSLFGFWSTAGDQLEIRVGGYYHEFRARYNYGSTASITLDGGVDLGTAENNIQNDIFIVCNSDGDWEGYLYTDNTLQDSSTKATTVGGFSTYNRMSFGAPTSYGDGAPVVIGNHWDRALSTSEIRSLVLNPYAFLRPAANEYYPVTYETTQAADGVYYLKDYGVPTSKPVGNVSIDFNHPLARGLIHYCPSADQLVDIVTGTPASSNVAPSMGATGRRVIDLQGGSDLITFDTAVKSLDEFTLWVEFENSIWANNANDDKGKILETNGGLYSGLIFDDNIRFAAQGLSDVFKDITSHQWGIDERGTISFTYDGSTKLQYTGVQDDWNRESASEAATGSTNAGTSITIGGVDGGTDNATFRFISFGIWDRALSASELESLHKETHNYAFLQQTPSYIPIGAAANDSGGTDALTATSVESASTVSSNTLTQVHSLTATSVESASTVSSPTLAEGSHVLTATSVESASTVSTNTLTQEHALTATSVESASTVSTPTLTSVAGTDVLTAVSVESASTVNTPTLGQTHVFTATSVETTTEVTTSSLTQVHILAANDVEAASTLSAVAIDRAELTSSEVATRFVSNANYYRVVSDANIYRVDN